MPSWWTACAGAIILGKTNLQEFVRGSVSRSLGGQSPVQSPT
jgi:Asp-tRNA(Asn)/Glu-tRNA(Gln) amidotransferase A subunit family amidase